MKSLQLTQSLYPSVLTTNPSLLFHLRCRHFLEVVRNCASHMDSAATASRPWLQEAMVVGQQLQNDFENRLGAQEQALLEVFDYPFVFVPTFVLFSPPPLADHLLDTGISGSLFIATSWALGHKREGGAGLGPQQRDFGYGNSFSSIQGRLF